ncbi:MAG TPA: SDR family oxidoreductase [Casimicrobiaceae bacterium]|nr:SDR family oxidoreductase [Casimicrobiaceae bacterium]
MTNDRSTPGATPPSAPIAVIGMSLRVPGAATLERFWRNLVEGRDCIERRPAAALRQSGLRQELLAHPDFVRAQAMLDGIEDFDAGFFDLSAPEAEFTDPSHRLFLECAWEALESAGVVPGRNAPVVGVFGGDEGDYRKPLDALADDAGSDPSLAIRVRIGNSLDFLTTRVSHKLDLQGPSFGVMAACATSLLAIDLAVQSLRRGECGVALAGGSTILLSQKGGYLAGVEGMLSPSGRLRPFDADADGTIFGSGVGVVALRPLADALAAGNPIHAVIRGAASSNDGNPPGKESFIAPSASGQVVAIEAALRNAGVSPETIGYVEAHGTGTRLGDPVEIAALTEVYRRHTGRTGFCSLGSVKGNVGHLRCAAGVASFIKACLALEHRTLPPLANFARPNPRIDFPRSPFFVHAEARPWRDAATPRRAAVSSFGFGGANAHVVLEEHVPAAAQRSSRRTHFLPVSARNGAALARGIEGVVAHLDAHPELDAADVAHTLQSGRRAFDQRALFVAEGAAIASAARTFERPVASGVAPSGSASCVFVFPGQGAQRRGAGRDLYLREPLFRTLVDECAQALVPELGLDLRALLGYVDGAAADEDVLRSTANAQPALFVVGYATARLLMSWGVSPAAMLGHSLGEIVAACLAGVFSLADGVKLVAARARLMQACEPGAMAAVFAPEALVAQRLPASLEVGAVNAPSVTVVSGTTDAVSAYCEAAEREGVATHRIPTSHAFHSTMMEPALPAFARVLEGISLSPPSITVISNATGLPLTPAQATDPRYWADHIRHPVRFSAGVRHALTLPHPAFVELGPGSTLCDLIVRHDPQARVFPFLAAACAADEVATSHAALGGLWCAGVEVDWARAAAHERRALVALPTYPFQRSRHWHDERPPAPDPRKTLYEPAYAEAPLPATALDERGRTWLVVGEDRGLGRAVRARIEAAGGRVATLIPGERFIRVDATRFQVRPDSRDDFDAAMQACLSPVTAKGLRVLHLGSVTGSAGAHNSAEAFEAAARTGFHSLVAFTQAAYDQGIADDVDSLVITDGLVRLDGEPGARFAEKAAVVGASRTISRDIPGLRMRVADIPSQDDDETPEWLVEALVREAGDPEVSSMVCLRRARRLVERLYELPALPRGRPRLREGGVVLVTGGTGALGLLFAAELFDLCRARLVLTARWDLPAEETWPERARRDDRVGRSLAAILDLRARGAEVMVVSADVADRKQVARAIAATKARFGALHGVIHGAGVLLPAPVIEKTRRSVAKVFAPKVHGAFHLEELLADEPLDLFMHLSSQSSHFPAHGQVDYAAANAVLDAMAQNRAARLPGLSCATGWGPWQEVGIAATRVQQSLDADFEWGRAASAGARDAEFESLDHPILRSRFRDGDGELTYRGVLRRGHWLVDDHLLEGRSLLSGTSTIQLVSTAFADHSTGEGAIELTGVAFVRPLFTDKGGTEFEIRFARARDDEAFTLRSRPLGTRDAWRVHVTGFVRNSEVAPRPVRALPPATAWERVPAGPPFGGRLLTGTGRWRWKRFELEHDGRTWDRVVLPSDFLDDLEVFELHPSLLDGAIMGACRAIAGESVPHTFDCIRIFGALAPELVAVTEHRPIGGSIASDITIADPAGRTLVEIEGFVKWPLEGSSMVHESRARMDASAAPPAGDGEASRAVVAEPGELASIRVVAFVPRAPQPGEVEIEVHATGLNFRDVLSALGEMPGIEAGAYTPGSECSGVVRAVGAGVRRLAPGDRVVAIARGALATHVTVPAHCVAILPDSLDFPRAAGLPIVFLTADYALRMLARMAPGERVLIHAGAGGVGLAALQIARQLGAEVFATAGHPDKRAYLRSLGVEQVFDSRTLAFVEGIRDATRGEGVDVVLNSLAGEFIPASLGLLRPQGRFIEIGKRDLLADAKLGLAPFLRNLSFSAFDLGSLFDAKDPRVGPMFDELMDRFARGELQPTPTHVVPYDRIEEGFQRMARAQHIGKIVFEVRPDTSVRGAVARGFEDMYGTGVPIAWGLDVFRRILTWSESPPYVLAMGSAVDGVGAAHAKPRSVGIQGRGREGLATAYRAPHTEVEKALTALWERTLGIAPIGVDDHFFDLGGDSIEAIQIQHAIQREFHQRVKNTEFLVDPTIAALAVLITARRESLTAAAPA